MWPILDFLLFGHIPKYTHMHKKIVFTVITILVIIADIRDYEFRLEVKRLEIAVYSPAGHEGSPGTASESSKAIQDGKVSFSSCNAV